MRRNGNKIWIFSTLKVGVKKLVFKRTNTLFVERVFIRINGIRMMDSCFSPTAIKSMGLAPALEGLLMADE